MDTFDCAKQLRGLVHVTGGAFLTAPETYAAAPGIGLEPDFDFYIAGRFGVLGDAPIDVVAGSAVFVHPDMLAEGWRRARAVAPPELAAAHLAECCANWGRTHLDDETAAETVVALGGRVVSSASPVAAPLFAGWRGQPLPDDPAGAAALTLQQLRELRMAHHVIAITVEGLTPLEAIVAGPGGPANAQMFGWPEPYPDPEPLKPRRDDAEQLTTRLAARDLEILDPTQRSALVDTVSSLRARL